MNMENLRNEIDEIDDSLVKLFEKRMQSTAQLAKYKKEHSVPVSDRTREREIIYRMSGKVTPELAGYTKSLYNTPPAYGIYICGKVFKWLQKRGGLEAMKEYNEKKAKILYDFLDESKLFKGTVRKEDRSLMNVPFITGNADLDAKFVAEAKKNGLENLKGHRSVGGMRASIYNAMPMEGVEKLVAFMKEFEAQNQ